MIFAVQRAGLPDRSGPKRGGGQYAKVCALSIGPGALDEHKTPHDRSGGVPSGVGMLYRTFPGHRTGAERSAGRGDVDGGRLGRSVPEWAYGGRFPIICTYRSGHPHVGSDDCTDLQSATATFQQPQPQAYAEPHETGSANKNGLALALAFADEAFSGHRTDPGAWCHLPVDCGLHLLAVESAYRCGR